MEAALAFFIMAAIVVALAIIIRWAALALLGALGAPGGLGTLVTVVVVLVALYIIWTRGQGFIGQFI